MQLIRGIAEQLRLKLPDQTVVIAGEVTKTQNQCLVLRAVGKQERFSSGIIMSFQYSLYKHHILHSYLVTTKGGTNITQVISVQESIFYHSLFYLLLHYHIPYMNVPVFLSCVPTSASLLPLLRQLRQQSDVQFLTYDHQNSILQLYHLPYHLGLDT